MPNVSNKNAICPGCRGVGAGRRRRRDVVVANARDGSNYQSRVGEVAEEDYVAGLDRGAMDAAIPVLVLQAKGDASDDVKAPIPAAQVMSLSKLPLSIKSYTRNNVWFFKQ